MGLTLARWANALRSLASHRGVRTVETLPDLPVRHRRWLAGDAGRDGLLLSQTLIEFSANDPNDLFFGLRVGGVGLVLLGGSGERWGPQAWRELALVAGFLATLGGGAGAVSVLHAGPL